MGDIIQPDPTGPLRLMKEITGFFSRLDYVLYVEVFGSLARDDWDRWSDIDMIVVTDNRSQFRAAFDNLCQHKAVLYHGPFTPNVDPCGGRILGIVFENESVFHCLDLNFLTITEYQTKGSLSRFGCTRQLYSSTGAQAPIVDNDYLSGEIEDPVENRISTAVHFTKKNAKKVLRGGKDVAELHRWSKQLKAAIQDVEPESRQEIIYLARSYIKIADALIRNVY